MAHVQGLLDAEFSLNGEFIVTTSGDNTGRLFSAETGELLAEFHGATDRVMGADISPDGMRVVTASEDGNARVYSCVFCGNDQELLLLAKQRLSEWLTPEELSQYLQLQDQRRAHHVNESSQIQTGPGS
jgi:WD40 repeat protein